jgi:glycosyltransferase involved in cell wall biosynthesis
VHERELEHAHDEVRKLSQANHLLRAERAALEARWSDLERSRGWLLLQKVRGMRIGVFGQDTFPGRSWSRLARFIGTARSAGIRAAIRKTIEKIAGKVARPTISHPVSETPVQAAGLPRDAPLERFLELPWNGLRRSPQPAEGVTGHLKILLVSHSACRTGAPLLLLGMARELAANSDVECWIVVNQPGELVESFAGIAPVLEVNDLAAQGISREEAPHRIASAFHDFSSRGIAICNTMAISAFHAALAEQNVPVLAWIHELPTFIDLLGGREAIDRIKMAARTIMVPAEAVRTALSTEFDIDPARVRTVFYGQHPATLGLDREMARGQVRLELGIPADALIVLGCGTIDLRKGADIFVSVARKVLTDPSHASIAGKTWFVWAGRASDETLARWLRHDLAKGDEDDRIRFIGTKSAMAPYYLAADVLALTSREDPCPLVNMEAMESGLPVVAFYDAGGAPEVLAGAGLCVPYVNVDAMARSICDLLNDPARRSRLGHFGQKRIRRRFTWSRFMDQVWEILRTEFDHRASQDLKVSVIVPNYRHAQYLPERLESIFNQTLRPHEIIFLDDSSPDDSVTVARRLAQLAPVPMRIIVNDQNSGSTFRQWMKGLELATGDLVWIAESDDSAHPMFLERLVPEFFDPEVVLAYCQSALIGPDGESLAPNFLGHTEDISRTRWRSRYSVPAALEAEEALSQKNTIPNASAVLFRRPGRIDFVDELFALKFAGDWLFYALFIKDGKISFLPEVLNHYRRHEQTVSHRSVREDTQPLETLSVKAHVFETFGVSAGAVASSLARTVVEYNQLTERFKLNRPPLTENPRLVEALNRIRAYRDQQLGLPSALKLLLVVDLRAAARQAAAILQLAAALADEHTVFLSCVSANDGTDDALAQLDERVILLEGTFGHSAYLESGEQGTEAASRRAQVLTELIAFHRIDVVYTPSWSAQCLILQLISSLRVPWLIHLNAIRDVLARRAATDATFTRTATAIVSAATGMFYERESDFLRIERQAVMLPAGAARWLIEPDSPIDRIATNYAHAFRDVCKNTRARRAGDLSKPITRAQNCTMV